MIDEKAELLGDLGIDIITTMRRYKSEQQWSMKEELKEIILVSSEPEFKTMIAGIEGDLRAVLNVKKISFAGKTTLESEKMGVGIGVVHS